MAFAEVALAQIKSLRQTAVPRNYEIWYVYATGYNAPLNKIINETLARNGRLTEADLEQIYETYLSHIKTTDRIDKVGARVIGEIDDVMTLIEDALGMSASYDDTLSGATEKLAVAQNRDQVKTIIDSLMKSTREMRETNKALQDRLTLSKSEIGDLQQSLEAIRAESLTDPLTGLGNRKYFDRFFFSSRRRHTRFDCDWSSDVCSSDLRFRPAGLLSFPPHHQQENAFALRAERHSSLLQCPASGGPPTWRSVQSYVEGSGKRTVRAKGFWEADAPG